MKITHVKHIFENPFVMKHEERGKWGCKILLMQCFFLKPANKNVCVWHAEIPQQDLLRYMAFLLSIGVKKRQNILFLNDKMLFQIEGQQKLQQILQAEIKVSLCAWLYYLTSPGFIHDFEEGLQVWLLSQSTLNYYTNDIPAWNQWSTIMC